MDGEHIAWRFHQSRFLSEGVRRSAPGTRAVLSRSLVIETNPPKHVLDGRKSNGCKFNVMAIFSASARTDRILTRFWVAPHHACFPIVSEATYSSKVGDIRATRNASFYFPPA